MPTYQYRCTECGHDLEAVQKFSDDPLTECPACGGALRKVYNAVGIVFKGSGFYATDSRKGKSGGASGAAEPTAAAPANASAKTADGAATTPAKADSSAPSTAPKDPA